MVKQTFEIIDGVYVGPEVWEGDLDLSDYKDTLTSLGSLKEVTRSLWLEDCTKLTSLDSLTEVGNWVDIRDCTRLASLGSLKKVGRHVYFDGIPFTLQEVQEEIRYYSSLLSHEALNALHTDEVQKIPLYKNILLQTLQGG